jgi:hypothetical protein
MPALTKARHERFAQSIANGKDLADAYEEAGYKRNRGNASILSRKESIQNRVQSLLDERAGAVTKKTAIEIEYNRDRLLTMLQDAYDEAIHSEKGQSAAVSAVVAMARITGQIIDRREVGDVGAFDGLTDDELVSEAAKKARELGVAGPKLVDTTPDES